MIKRNITAFLIIISNILLILSFDFSNFDFESKKTWLFLASLVVIITAIILMFIKENKNNKITH